MAFRNHLHVALMHDMPLVHHSVLVSACVERAECEWAARFGANQCHALFDMINGLSRINQHMVYIITQMQTLWTKRTQTHRTKKIMIFFKFFKPYKAFFEFSDSGKISKRNKIQFHSERRQFLRSFSTKSCQTNVIEWIYELESRRCKIPHSSWTNRSTISIHKIIPPNFIKPHHKWFVFDAHFRWKSH